MKVLIIGGTGILSTAVVDECVNKSIDVYMINRGRRKLFINEKVHLIKCDVHNKERVQELIAGLNFDAVIDFLCYTKEDLEYSLNLFSKLSNQYVFISSTAVYNTSINQIFSEDSEKIQSLWPYSVGKNECEKYLQEYCALNNINYTIVRPGVNYGNTRIPYGIYPAIGYHWTLVERILHKKPIITWNNGENRGNITRVEDFAMGTVGLLGKKEAYNEAFNVVGDDFYSWDEVLQTLAKVLGKEVVTIDIPKEFYAEELGERKGELLGGRAQNCMCSNEKLKKIVPSFKTTISLEEGIKKTLEFYEKNDYLFGIDYDYESDTDRIICKYLTSIHQDCKSFNLKYIKYINSPIIKSFLKYYFNFYKNNSFVKLLFCVKRNIMTK